MGFKELLTELKKLNLPKDQFAIFGGGPMSVRGLKEANDIDIIVKKELWDGLAKKYPYVKKNNSYLIKIGDDLEIYSDWLPWFPIEDIDMLIDTADVIDGIRYVKLENVIRWKKEYARDKDLKDIKLIEKWQKSN
jgi:hypothetical protein